MGDTLTESEISIDQLLERPWICIVWDDPVNLMSYVTFVLIKVFGFSKEKAHDKMMQVHIEGRSVVATGWNIMFRRFTSMASGQRFNAMTKSNVSIFKNRWFVFAHTFY